MKPYALQLWINDCVRVKESMYWRLRMTLPKVVDLLSLKVTHPKLSLALSQCLPATNNLYPEIVNNLTLRYVCRKVCMTLWTCMSMSCLPSFSALCSLTEPSQTNPSHSTVYWLYNTHTCTHTFTEEWTRKMLWNVVFKCMHLSLKTLQVTYSQCWE